MAEGHYHVVARAVAGEPLFRDDADREWFVACLQITAKRLRWELFAYCLMTTHYHLVARTPEPNLARGVQRVNGRYAQEFNQRWKRFGHLFAERYSAGLIESEEHLAEACRYVLENPVKAGVCKSPWDWPWSGGHVFEDLSRV
jgi:REP-associated tyrosine transposase